MYITAGVWHAKLLYGIYNLHYMFINCFVMFIFKKEFCGNLHFTLFVFPFNKVFKIIFPSPLAFCKKTVEGVNSKKNILNN